jgi:nucleoside-diphosphate-sugar epimerase
MEIFGRLPTLDIHKISSDFSSEFAELESVNFLIVGASGFLGRWISTSLAYMQLQGLFRGKLYLLVRNMAKIAELESLSMVPNRRIVPISTMDKKTFSDSDGARTIIIYAASSTSEAGKPLKANSGSYLDLPLRVVDCLPTHEVTFVHLSSGAVYDPSARLQERISGSEKVQISSNDSYTAEKIMIEQWLDGKGEESSMTVRNPRLFAFYGPGLQLDRHFAIGEFMRNGMSKMPISIKGNLGNLRSYLHPRDAVNQIFQNCLSADPLNTQIGSRNVLTIETLAHVIAREFNVNVEVLNADPSRVDNYVPLDIPERQEKNFELGISEWRKWLEIS